MSCYYLCDWSLSSLESVIVVAFIIHSNSFCMLVFFVWLGFFYIWEITGDLFTSSWFIHSWILLGGSFPWLLLWLEIFSIWYTAMFNVIMNQDVRKEEELCVKAEWSGESSHPARILWSPSLRVAPLLLLTLIAAQRATYFTKYRSRSHPKYRNINWAGKKSVPDLARGTRKRHPQSWSQNKQNIILEVR